MAFKPFGGFKAKVLLKDPTYEVRGMIYFVPEWWTWGEVPYLEPHQCCCNHAPLECHFEEHGCTMCRVCRESWEQDHIVQLPNLV